MTWLLERFAGAASVFHARALPDPLEATVWMFDVDRPALVLGSAQPDGHVDRDACERFGVEVVRRRSGGGAVLLLPGESLWIDVVVPSGHAVWTDDVGVSPRWLGQCWARALGRGARVHEQGMIRTELSPYVCFAGLGPGEVLVDDRKAVGISQRRTRFAARFQSVACSRLEPRLMASLLMGPDRAHVVRALTEDVAVVDLSGLAERFVAALPV